MTTTQELPLPSIDPLAKPFWEGTRHHKLMMQKCPACGRFHWLPAPSCQSCGNSALVWEEVKGTGTIYTFTEVHRVVRNIAFVKKTPYLITMVQLDQGPRIITNITDYGGLDNVKVGMSVEVIFDDVSPDITLPRFKISNR